MYSLNLPLPCESFECLTACALLVASTIAPVTDRRTLRDTRKAQYQATMRASKGA